LHLDLSAVALELDQFALAASAVHKARVLADTDDERSFVGRIEAALAELRVPLLVALVPERLSMTLGSVGSPRPPQPLAATWSSAANGTPR
jgi:hypothetical protein